MTSKNNYDEIKLRDIDTTFNLFDYNGLKTGIKVLRDSKQNARIDCLTEPGSNICKNNYGTYSAVDESLRSTSSSYYTCTPSDINAENSVCNNANTYLNKSIFNLEKDLLDALNDFNKDYAIYVRCTDKRYDSATGKYTLDQEKTLCSDPNITIPSLKEKLDKAINISERYTMMLNLRSDSGTGISSSNYNADYSSILGNHASNLKLRNELDMKMNELLNSEKSVGNMYKRINHSVVYTNIAWTILASSVIYYVFINLT